MERTINSNGRGKVELLLNQPAKLKLLKDKPFEGSSTYGPYFLYSVEHDGVEKAYFATEEVHQEIQGLGLKRGDEVVLTKTAQQNGRRVVPIISVMVPQRPKSEVKPESEIKPARQSDGLKAIMEESLREAVEIMKSIPEVPFQNEDIQKIASCLFIARARHAGFGT